MDCVFSNTYNGPRFTYGLRYRPMQIGAQPKGFIIGSVVDDPLGRYTFGTVQYPRELTVEECAAYEMERIITAGETIRGR